MMNNDDQILNGFNDGYIVQKYEPELAGKLIADLNNTDEPYAQGFVAGAKEYQMEKELDKSDLFPGMDEGLKSDFPHEESEKNLNQEDKGFDIEI